MKIHFLSDSLRMNSGFSIVSKNLMLEFMKRGHECTMTGLQQSFLKEKNYGIDCYPLNVGHISEEVRYVTNLMTVKPDIVFNIFGSDTETMDGLLQVPLQLGIKNRIWYCPVDGKELGVNSIYSLKSFEESGGKIVAQCKWGYEQMKESGINVIDYIYHGYDEKIFKKLDKKWNSYCYYRFNDNNPCNEYICNLENCSGYKEEQIGIMKWIINKEDNNKSKWKYAECSISSIKELVNGKFVFGFVGANFGLRKRIERLLKSYSMLIENNEQLKGRTLMWLHTLPKSNVGINLINVIKKLKLEKNVILSYNGNGNSFSEEAMCRLYNIFDCHVSASSGEGFGLPILESMACGVSQIGTNICSFPELIGKQNERGYLVDCELQMIQDESFRGLINEKNLTERMKQMYDISKVSTVFGDNCLNFVKDYTWNNVTNSWLKLFKWKFNLM